MKKYLLFIFILPCSKLFAQVPEDAIHYSWLPHNGTARNMAIGGVMGSLGGDLTALFVNPAGLAFYKTKELVLTPGIALNNIKVSFRGNDTKEKNTAFNLGPTGIIFGWGERVKDGATQSSAVSIAINQTANFQNTIHYKGLNNFSSFSEQFAEEFAKSGMSIDDVLNNNSRYPYSSAPALYTYLIDTVTINGGIQVKGVPEYLLDAGQALQQEMTRTSKGGLYELAFGAAHNDWDKWFYGLTLGVPIIFYESNTTFTETDTSNISNGFRSFEYIDNYRTLGAGLNGRIGVIYRPREYIRLGLAIQTPNFMFLSDKRTVTLTSNLEKPNGMPESFTVTSADFTVDQPSEKNYNQQTAWKALLSASYVFREVENVKKQRGFISADVEFVNHKYSRFSTSEENASEGDKDYYSQLKKVIKKEYKGAFNFRVGGELKFNTIMARLGFAY
ncbi:MAG TPA: hypothetical protein VK498_08710, partial [Ferruginibacter sp.]|nr:hypothetical protein [Ferruginibacter sp.]